MNILIRKATENDYADIVQLIQEFATFQNMPEKMTNSVERIMRESEHFDCLVAETKDENIVGYATYFFAYFTWSGKCLYMDDLFVKEKFRGNGIGKELMRAVLDFAKKAKCHKIRWQVSKWNKKAQQFYKNRGAKIDDVEINCDLVLDKY